MTGKLVSVVIPALNEEARIGHVIEQLRADNSAAFEIIVVDGGSTDRTVAIARGLESKIVVSPPGRGHQIAAGAATAKGDVLWFLHVDSQVSGGTLAAVRQAVDGDRRSGGNFRVIFDGDGAFAEWLTGFYAWFRRRGLYYGDSGVFIRRDVYDEIGGVQPMALMEDYDLTRRMERFGGTCCIDTPAIVTSSRKFQGRRPIGIVLGWIRIHALYRLGVKPERLARIYYGR
mgnify:FL=1